MGQRDDLVDALGGDGVDGRLDRRGVDAEQDVVARRGQFRGVVGDGADDGDLLTADIEDRVGLHLVAQLRAVAGEHVGAENRELDLVEEGGEAVLAVVELVVADGHHVGLHQVQEFRFHRALVGRVEQRTLEIVTGVQEHHVLAVHGLARVADRGYEPGRAAEALALGFIVRRAGRIIFADRLDAAVPVVDVENVQGVVGKRGRCRHRQRRGRQCRHICEVLHG